MTQYLRTACAIGILVMCTACGQTDKKGARTESRSAPTADNSEQLVKEAPAPEPMAERIIGGKAESEELMDIQAPSTSMKKKSVAKGRPARRMLSPSIGSAPIAAAPPPPMHTEGYDHIQENDFTSVAAEPLSTFSIDVDTASYANVRRLLESGRKPPAGAVRIEEMLNYFNYDYPAPRGSEPFATHVEVAGCPWQSEHRLVRIGIKGREVAKSDRKQANLVFLLDVSGSMNSPNKLPLLKRTFKLAVRQLNARDRVAIVVYAGASGLVLPSTSFDNANRIMEALDNLSAGGSTNGGQGIQLAYRIARENFIPGGINRVILATDGDFNVGTTSKSELVDLVEKKAKEKIELTVLGFGMGNYKDDLLEKLADKGNGNYGYIDTFKEARKVFADQIGGTLETIAKDVKIQVEFNPTWVDAYRLIGYENRKLAAQDFNDDTKDAGEIGAGHTVTALYEIVPKGKGSGKRPAVDPLKYQKNVPGEAAISTEILNLKLRFKPPTGDVSTKIELPVTDSGTVFAAASPDFRFATAVAGFGMLLRESKHKGDVTFGWVQTTAQSALGEDPNGYRRELLGLVEKAKPLYARPVQIAR